jgi:hypothetical protein
MRFGIFWSEILDGTPRVGPEKLSILSYWMLVNTFAYLPNPYSPLISARNGSKPTARITLATPSRFLTGSSSRRMA